MTTERDQARSLFFEALDHYDAGRFEEAESLLREADRLAPNTAPVVANLAATLYRLGRVDDSARHAEAALKLDPGSAAAKIILASCLKDAGEHAKALALFDAVLSENQNDVEAWLGRGNALTELRRVDEAEAAYDMTLRLAPGTARAIAAKGRIAAERRRPAEAARLFDAARAADPTLPHLLGAAIQARLGICDWTGYNEALDELRRSLAAGFEAAMPFDILALPTTPEEQLLAARLYGGRGRTAAPPIPARARSGRIRLGYFSSDFQEHATAYLTAGLFEHHDRSRFETFAFSFGPDGETPMRLRLRKAFDHFLEVREKSDREVVGLARELEIDIAIDLHGFAGGGRPGIFTLRAAPIQVNYLGYPGTMGRPEFDYIIADQTVIPPEQEASYSEKVLRLPGSYQPNDRLRPRPEASTGPVDAAIEAASFVFCSFNSNYKITPDIFDVWMRILGRVPGSVLWLMEGHADVPQNLRREAERRGISGERIVFAKTAPLPEHLARYHRVGLFLDTLHYNAHTTASDALWMAVPVITCPGRTFASRVAASLLRAAGMPETITRSLAEYEDLVIALATDRGRLAQLKARLVANRLTCRLFDTEGYAVRVERAYEHVKASIDPKFLIDPRDRHDVRPNPLH